jgi:hypothetical protein
VQFVPVFNDLTRDALAAAETADFDGVPFRGSIRFTLR